MHAFKVNRAVEVYEPMTKKAAGITGLVFNGTGSLFASARVATMKTAA
jgi:hypothetical protein